MKGKINIKKQPAIHSGGESQPKIVQSYRIDPEVLETAEKLCRKKHDCGISSLIQPLIIAYFGEHNFVKHG